jgi:hypothetical protein
MAVQLSNNQGNAYCAAFPSAISRSPPRGDRQRPDSDSDLEPEAARCPLRSDSQVRRRSICGRWQGMQPENPRHGRGFRAPRAPRSQHQRGDRREGGTIDGPQINCPARATAWVEHIEPGRPCDQRSPDRGDHRMSRLATSCSFQRSMTAFASARAAASATCRFALMAMSRPRVRTPMRQ